MFFIKRPMAFYDLIHLHEFSSSFKMHIPNTSRFSKIIETFFFQVQNHWIHLYHFISYLLKIFCSAISFRSHSSPLRYVDWLQEMWESIMSNVIDEITKELMELLFMYCIYFLCRFWKYFPTGSVLQFVPNYKNIRIPQTFHQASLPGNMYINKTQHLTHVQRRHVEKTTWC